MIALDKALSAIGRILVWWIVVAPWEKGVRVRFGKCVHILDAGIHWRFPVIDRVYLQGVRLRTVDLSTQTVTTTCGTALTVAGNVSYSIGDIRQVFDTLSQPEDTLADLANSAIARFVSSHNLAECRHELIERAASTALELDRYGLSEGEVHITDLVAARTYRLMMEGSRWLDRSDRLSTTVEHGKKDA